MARVSPKAALEKIEANDPSLTELDLSNNAVYNMKSMEYTEKIAAALAKNTHLTSIKLSHCSIMDLGCQQFAEALKTNKTLTYLDLSNNKIGSNGLIALCEMLETNNTLLEINLFGQSQPFGEPALARVVQMFEHNTTLLNIEWRLDSRQAWAITKAFSRNKEIQRRKAAGRSYEDLDPAARRNKAASVASQSGSNDFHEDEVKAAIASSSTPQNEADSDPGANAPVTPEPSQEEPVAEEKPAENGQAEEEETDSVPKLSDLLKKFLDTHGSLFSSADGADGEFKTFIELAENMEERLGF